MCPYPLPQASRSALFTLLRLGAGSVLPWVVEEACQVLGRAEVLETTEEQMEIMCTPSGQLWHKGMLQE